jgi:hypothetical protein
MRRGAQVVDENSIPPFMVDILCAFCDYFPGLDSDFLHTPFLLLVFALWRVLRFGLSAGILLCAIGN